MREWQNRNGAGGEKENDGADFEFLDLEVYRLCRMSVEGKVVSIGIMNRTGSFSVSLGVEHPMAGIISEWWADEEMREYLKSVIHVLFMCANSLMDTRFLDDFVKAYMSLCKRMGVDVPELTEGQEKEALEGEAVKDYVRKNTSRIYAEGMDAVEDMRRVSKDAEVATGKS